MTGRTADHRIDYAAVTPERRTAASGTPRCAAVGRALLAAALAAAGLLAPVVGGTQGQSPQRGAGGAGGGGAAAGVRVQEGDVRLARVVMFTSGVAYYERSGTVRDDATVELEFRTAQVSDLLKSMVVRDLDGGAVTGVSYSSRDPLARTLRTFGVDLSSNPSVGQLLAQLRGERVEVALQSGSPLTGTVVGIETRQLDKELSLPLVNVLTENGIRSAELRNIASLRLLDAQLDSELRAALELIADSRDDDAKTVAVRFAGSGQRRVRIGYLLESPVWKSTYRLVLDSAADAGAGRGGGAEAAGHLLQGWGVVENTTEEDWHQVALTLVAGRPISFRMEVYQPLYVPRPLVQFETATALAPRDYDPGVAARRSAPQPAPSPSAGSDAAPMEQTGAGPSFADDFDDGAAREQIGQSVTAARAGSAGELFQYEVPHPVTVPRKQSAMVPVVNADIQGRRLSIYDPNVHRTRPLNGLLLTNTTGLDLAGGPITVFENGVYAGDAIIGSLAAGDRRLLSYSLDLDTLAQVQSPGQPERLVAVSIQRGTLFSTRVLRSTTDYTFVNRGTRDREVLVEQPLQSGWQLLEPTEPFETTDRAYRFIVPLPGVGDSDDDGDSDGESRTLTVRLERRLPQSIALTNLDSDRMAVYIRASAVSEAIKDALRRLGELRAALIELGRDRQNAQRRIDAIHREQSRLRQNMEVLDRETDLYRRYLQQLDQQEDQLDQLQQEIDQLTEQEDAQRTVIDDYIASLRLE